MDLKTFTAAAALLAAAVPATAAERSFTVTDFNRVRVEGPYRVKLTTGVAPFARAAGSQDGLNAVSIEVQGRTLVVRPNRSSWGGYPGQSSGPVDISIGTHDLTTAWINGSGALAVTRVKGLTFDLSVQGSGSVSLASADVDQMRVTVLGTGGASAGGKAGKLTAIVRGAAFFDGSALKVKDAVLGAEGASTIRAEVSGSAKVDAAGTATVELAGKPGCTVKALGSAVVSGC